MITNMFIDGENWEIKGDVEFDLANFEVKLEASNSGAIYGTKEAVARIVAVDEIKANPKDIPKIIEFLTSCKATTEKFTATLVLGEDCSDSVSEYIFSGCLINGTPKYSISEKKIDGFEFGYEQVTMKGGN